MNLRSSVSSARSRSPPKKGARKLQTPAGPPANNNDAESTVAYRDVWPLALAFAADDLAELCRARPVSRRFADACARATRLLPPQAYCRGHHGFIEELLQGVSENSWYAGDCWTFEPPLEFSVTKSKKVTGVCNCAILSITFEHGSEDYTCDEETRNDVTLVVRIPSSAAAAARGGRPRRLFDPASPPAVGDEMNLQCRIAPTDSDDDYFGWRRDAEPDNEDGRKLTTLSGSVLRVNSGDNDVVTLDVEIGSVPMGYNLWATTINTTKISYSSQSLDKLWSSYSDGSFTLSGTVWSYCSRLWSFYTDGSFINTEGVIYADGVIPRQVIDSLRANTDVYAAALQSDPDYHAHSRNAVRNNIVDPALFSFIDGVTPLRQGAVLPTGCSFPAPVAVQHEDLDEKFRNASGTIVGCAEMDRLSQAQKELDKEALAASCPCKWPSVRYDGSFVAEDGPPETPQKWDLWKRKYERSQYQWLPTYFNVMRDGTVNIQDYINNLSPRQAYEPLYTALAGLFSHALPLIESTCAYANAARKAMRGTDGDPEQVDNYGQQEYRLPTLPDERQSLRGKSLQVITKIVDYDLAPGDSFEEDWHIEGMPHEGIVATCLYILDHDDDLLGGDLDFKRSFFEHEANHMDSNVSQHRNRAWEKAFEDGLKPLGRVATPEGRLIVFPNSHVHRVMRLSALSSPVGYWVNGNVEPFDSDDEDDGLCISSGVEEEEEDAVMAAAATEDACPSCSETPKSHRRIVVFFIVDPDHRIMSTREVAPQQVAAGGQMTLDEAMSHRLKLVEERMSRKQDWNVRELACHFR
jgi:hypothetical protein